MNRFRTLLMPLGVAGEARERMAGALAVAQYCQAHLDVLFTYISPKETIPADIFGMSKAAMDSLSQAADQHAAALAQERKQWFLDLCQQHAVPLTDEPAAQNAGVGVGVSAAWHQADGLRSTLVALRGRLVDLIVVAKPSKPGPSSLLEAVVTETGRPVLLMPRTQQVFNADHIAIGWNGSAQVARALDSAIPFIKAAKTITIFTTLDRKDNAPSVDDLRRYLAWHGQSTALAVMDVQTRSVGEALFSEANNIGANLLVLGGYSQRRLHEIISGSVTEHVLAAADLPVLMGH